MGDLPSGPQGAVDAVSPQAAPNEAASENGRAVPSATTDDHGDG